MITSLAVDASEFLNVDFIYDQDLAGVTASMQEMCRDSVGPVPVMIFPLFTCSMCYRFLFRGGDHFQPHSQRPWILVPRTGSDFYHENLTVPADITNVTSRGLVCRSLSSEDCDRWTKCCFAAIDCCKRQLSVPLRNVTSGPYCPRTWDGYGCFDDALPSTRSHITCPSYVDLASETETAYKDCTENGTWWIMPTTGAEWTNYSTCVPIPDYHTVAWVGLACNIVSLALLIPACLIFLGVRQLRVQKRIKLHLCLFLSFAINSIITIMWDFLIYVDRLNNAKEDTVMHKNSGGCRLLYILTRYVDTTSFFWMFCEGLYLHRLIVHAFSVPKTLIPYYIFGWLIACLPSIPYSLIRLTSVEYNTGCWVHSIGGYEWIMYTPNLLCIAANLYFLANILRILCSKLQASHNEPNNYRKALKATFVLIPLFGLQQFLFIYRPPPKSPVSFPYEIAQVIVNNTRGAAVALIFCFFNGEVYSHLRLFISKHIKPGSTSAYLRKGSMSSATQFTSVAATRRETTRLYETSDRGYIPLSTSTTTTSVGNNDLSPSNGHVSFAL